MLTYPKSHFSENHISAPRGCCAPKFLHALENHQVLNLNDTVRLAILENHTLEPKIMTVSYTQPKSYDCLKNCLVFPIGSIYFL